MQKRVSMTSGSLENQRPLPPAITPEGKEMQMISLAMDLVEQRLRNGTASSQETTHFLKLGSIRNQLEVEKLRKETQLLEVKKESLESSARMEKLYSDAMEAMKTYSGRGDDLIFLEDDLNK